MRKIKKRLLGAQEILFYAMNQASHKHFLMVGEVEGFTTKDTWRSAVKVLQTIHPMLRMSIVIDGKNLLYCEDCENSLPLEIDDLNKNKNINVIIEQELEKGFQSDKGPLVRVKLLFSEQKSIIIVAAHHSVSDALSSVNLINQLIEILQGEQLASLNLQPSVDEWLGFDNDSLAEKVNQQMTPGISLPHEFVRHHPPAKIQIVHFSKQLTDRLAYCAKKQTTSVHGALQSAAALSIRELAFEVGRPAYVMSPFSVRAEMNIATDCGLFIDTKIIGVSTDCSQTFWEVARSAKNELSDIHTTEFLKNSANQLRGLIYSSDDLIQFIKDNFNFDIMLSNLGRLASTKSQSKLKLTSLIGPFIISGFNHQQAIGATTFNDKLVLTNSSRYLIPGLLELIKTKIEAVCQN